MARWVLGFFRIIWRSRSICKLASKNGVLKTSEGFKLIYGLIARVGQNASSKIQIVTTLPDGKGEWWAQCNVYSGDGKTAEINCDSYRWGANNILSIATSGFHAELGKFYTVAIEITPDASNVRYYLNGNKIGDYQPAEKSLLAKANFRWHIGLYVNSGGTTGAVDNVMVGPASLPVTLTPTEITSVN